MSEDGDTASLPSGAPAVLPLGVHRHWLTGLAGRVRLLLLEPHLEADAALLAAAARSADVLLIGTGTGAAPWAEDPWQAVEACLAGLQARGVQRPLVLIAGEESSPRRLRRLSAAWPVAEVVYAGPEAGAGLLDAVLRAARR